MKKQQHKKVIFAIILLAILVNILVNIISISAQQELETLATICGGDAEAMVMSFAPAEVQAVKQVADIAGCLELTGCVASMAEGKVKSMAIAEILAQADPKFKAVVLAYNTASGLISTSSKIYNGCLKVDKNGLMNEIDPLVIENEEGTSEDISKLFYGEQKITEEQKIWGKDVRISKEEKGLFILKAKEGSSVQIGGKEVNLRNGNIKFERTKDEKGNLVVDVKEADIVIGKQGGELKFGNYEGTFPEGMHVLFDAETGFTFPSGQERKEIEIRGIDGKKSSIILGKYQVDASLVNGEYKIRGDIFEIDGVKVKGISGKGSLIIKSDGYMLNKGSIADWNNLEITSNEDVFIAKEDRTSGYKNWIKAEDTLSFEGYGFDIQLTKGAKWADIEEGDLLKYTLEDGRVDIENGKINIITKEKGYVVEKNGPNVFEYDDEEISQPASYMMFYDKEAGSVPAEIIYKSHYDNYKIVYDEFNKVEVSEKIGDEYLGGEYMFVYSNSKKISEEKLIQNLKNKNSVVREKSIALLRGSNNEKVANELKNLLDDENYDIKRGAISTIGYNGIKTGEIEDKLISLLEDEKMKTDVIKTLGEIGSKKAENKLTELFENKNEEADVRYGARRSLKMIGSELSFDGLTDLLKNTANFVVASDMVNTDKEKAKEIFRSLSEDKNKNLECVAAYGLKLIDSENIEAEDKLIELLDDEEFTVRDSALKAIKEVGSIRAEDKLVSLLKDEEKMGDLEVMEILGKLKSEKAIPYLANYLESKDEQERKWATKSLRRIGNENVVEELIKGDSAESLKALKENPLTLGYLMEEGDEKILKKMLDQDKLKDYAKIKERIIKVGGEVGPEDIYTLTNIDEHIISLASDRIALENKILKNVEEVSHTERTAHYAEKEPYLTESFLQQRGKLDESDLIKIYTLSDSFKDHEVKEQVGRIVKTDLINDRTELGGLIHLKEGKIDFEMYAPKCKGDDGAYIFTNRLMNKLRQSICSFHLHAVSIDEKKHAGPSIEDLETSEYLFRDDVVITPIGEGKFNADYYTPNGIVIDLGNYEY